MDESGELVTAPPEVIPDVEGYDRLFSPILQDFANIKIFANVWCSSLILV